ncbi:hypothetical protein [Acidovorax sp. Root217]|uniref:hypothetical protein n=1 Tax=Acidovorax sp. Root217 TaxID=1736492 RepID=UPI000709A188|nr:hypothetical protein [Acidovorax sp. Root217]KRC23614.1 hypothetical protein ASE31_03190 [Acidovorax sp. Root217]
MKPVSFCTLPLLLLLSAALLCSTAHADVTEAEAIEAQLGSALESADFAAKNCPNLAINDDKVQELLKRIKKTAADLRAGEDYDDQHRVVQQLDKQQGRAMICMVLPSAHGGYARGVIQKK